jgi:hypothetical protein
MTNYEAIISRVQKIGTETQMLMLRVSQMKAEIDRLKDVAMNMDTDVAMAEADDEQTSGMALEDFLTVIRGGRYGKDDQ